MVEIKKNSPPLRYPGSKFRAFKHIEPFINNIEHDEYREPFFGSGAVFFQKNYIKDNWINDIDKELMTVYRVIADDNKRNELIKRTINIVPTKEYFNDLQKYIPITDIDVAFKYFVTNRTAYSGIMNKPNFGFHEVKSVQPNKWGERLEQATERLKTVKITNIDYKEVIKFPNNGKKILMFIDPPYYKADQKRAYIYSFLEEQHIELCNILKELDNTKSKFCLTYDDCEEIREMYSWANITDKEWMYHTSNSNVTTRKKGKELIITNYNYYNRLF